MQQRLNLRTITPEGYKAVLALDSFVGDCGLERSLIDLVYLRASQINGCAYCTDIHWKDLRHQGVSEQKLLLLTCWREAPGFTARERAALEWAESLTLLTETHVPDSVFALVRSEFSDQEIGNLTIAVGMINLWNRVGVSMRNVAGAYQPAGPAMVESHV